MAAADTLLINAPASTLTSLKVRKDLTNNGRIQVISAYNSSSTFGNGTIANNIYTPFKSQSTDAKPKLFILQPNSFRAE
ncbi:MAG: hypothetical protein IPN36_15865 [Bacteroidetes bacterium]|nr:hypothetical protein [Bacteroidota bacterium]